MGFVFDIHSSSIVGYLTASNTRPPRVTDRELFDFLGVLVHGPDGGKISDVLISSSSEWVQSVQQAADRAYHFDGPPREWDTDTVSDNEFITRLAVLQTLFSNYNLFAMGLGDWHDSITLRTLINYAAVSSGHHALFLIPVGIPNNIQVQVRDPFPAVASALRSAHHWPGVVFWTKSTTTAFAPLPDAEDLYQQLRTALDSPPRLDQILAAWNKRRQGGVDILQVSDLHFGNDWAADKEPYVSTHLANISQSVGRVVITGDLFNNPRKEEARAFYSFRTALERERKQEALVIPGNHDQKWRGLGKMEFNEWAKVQWSTVYVDDTTNSVFFCFDSSRDADFAKGRVTVDQRIRVATEFDKLSLARPEIKEYLRVALIHHHVFSFETQKETLISRALANVGITDELLLRMDDADEFLSWCANRGIGLILHGHKHVPRYRREWIRRSDGTAQAITTVGCGTTLGAEGKPLSYNRLSWDPGSRSWNVSYFTDPGDGSGFVEEYISRGVEQLNS